MAALVVGGVLLVALVWWLFTLGKVEDRNRTEEVSMFDISQPPPPPPPPPEPEPVEQPEEAQVAETPQAVQPDPLSPPQPASTEPPAGDLTSLLQDPTANAPTGFTGGPRGQGGSGKGPLIGGTGKGGNAASRAYADLIKNAIMRQLRRDKDLAQEGFAFNVRVSVDGAASVKVVSVSNVAPPELEGAIRKALASFGSVDQPPPAGGPIPFVATINLNQQS